MKKIRTTPKDIFREYSEGSDFKAGIGDKGLFEQSKINERFYVGDHWYGARCGNDRPLVRRNIIRRIADYKLSAISASPTAINFSAEGIATNTVEEKNYKKTYDKVVSGKADFTGDTDGLEVSLIMNFLTDYGNSTAERLKFESKAYEALKNAYISGTGILYTYWNELTDTGLYADAERNVPIKGDIACEVLDVENVVFGDPNSADVQNQPYIIIAQRRDVQDVIREAGRNRIAADEIEQIKPDGRAHQYINAGTRGENEPSYSRRVTVYTKFYKEWDANGTDYRVMCVKCTDKVIIRRPFDAGVKLYPLAVMHWDSRRSSAYGESEITYLVPNQIAINRALSAQVWSLMLNGMPIMIVNGDVVENVTNDPGQIIKVYGDYDDVAGAVRYVQPPSFAGQMINGINDLADNTLSDSGANDAALGNVRPDNAAAIIQIREAALQPMQLKQNAYYTFIEDVMRIWADFWLNLYGDRMLKIDTDSGAAYVPFHADRYKKLLVNARVDVGASTLWSQSVVVSTLDSLLAAKVITPQQYLERMPENIIPNKTGLLNEFKEQQATKPAEAGTGVQSGGQSAIMQAAANALGSKPAQISQAKAMQPAAAEQGGISNESVLRQFAAEQPELYEKFGKLPAEQQNLLLEKMRQATGAAQ